MWIKPESVLEMQLLDTNSQELLPGSPLDVRIPVYTNVDRRRVNRFSSQWLLLARKVANGLLENSVYPLHRRIPPPLRWYRLKNLTTLKNVYGPVERGNSLLVQLQNNYPKASL